MAAGAATGAVAGFLSKTSDIVLEDETRFPSFTYSRVRHLPPPISPGVQSIKSREVEKQGYCVGYLRYNPPCMRLCSTLCRPLKRGRGRTNRTSCKCRAHLHPKSRGPIQTVRQLETCHLTRVSFGPPCVRWQFCRASPCTPVRA